MNNKAGIVILTENHLLKEELVNKIRSNDHYEIIATFNDGGICEDYLATHTCDLLVIDLILTNIDGAGVIGNIRSNNPKALKHVICISDFTNSLVFEMLEGLAVDYCLKKPVDLNYFMEIIDCILKIRLKHNLGIDDYHQTVLKKEIHDTFMKVGMPRHLKGYNYLVTAIVLVCGNINLLGEITKELYPRIARTYGTTASRVEQSIRHVLKCTWESGCQDELEQLFGFRAKRKTCNSEFISTIVDELLSKYKGS